MTIEGSFDVVGAKSAVAFFGASTPERLSHGYLFTGPAGVGKKTFARALARSLLCEKSKSGLLGYDDTCSGCTLFRAGTHPDYFEARGVVKIGSDAGSVRQDEQLTARDLVRALSLRGYAAKYRVVVLGDIAFATHEAANALLKFFEEPPSGVIVMLTSSVAGTLLPTIRSRFVEVPFSALTPDEIAALLTREGVDQGAAQRAASIAQGSVTQARAVLADEANGARPAAIAWLRDSLAGRAHDLRLDERGATPAERRAFLVGFVAIIRGLLRDWAALAVAGKDAAIVNGDLREQLMAFPKRDPNRVSSLLIAASEAERLAGTNVSAGFTAEYLRMQCAP